jgi:hypothetical protein
VGGGRLLGVINFEEGEGGEIMQGREKVKKIGKKKKKSEVPQVPRESLSRRRA